MSLPEPAAGGTAATGTEDARRAAGTPTCPDAGGFLRNSAEKPTYTLSQFEALKDLGMGSYGAVKLVKNKSTHELFAMKVLDKRRVVDRGLQEQLRREVLTQLKVAHPNVVRMHYYFEDGTRVYCLLEYADRGNLFGYLRQEGQGLPERQAARIFTHVIFGLQYLHSNGIIHRDLKPENILIFGKEMVAKIGDLGWCAELTTEDPLRSTICGTKEYLAPEMLLSEPYDTCVDLWTIGVLLYEMLMGKAPFASASHRELLDSVCFLVGNNYPDLAGLPEGADDIVKGLLRRTPSERTPLHKLLRHKWVETLAAEPQEELEMPVAGATAASAAAASAAAAAAAVALDSWRQLPPGEPSAAGSPRVSHSCDAEPPGSAARAATAAEGVPCVREEAAPAASALAAHDGKPLTALSEPAPVSMEETQRLERPIEAQVSPSDSDALGTASVSSVARYKHLSQQLASMNRTFNKSITSVREQPSALPEAAEPFAAAAGEPGDVHAATLPGDAAGIVTPPAATPRGLTPRGELTLTPQGAGPLASLPGDAVGSVTPPATSPRGITPRNHTPRGELTLTPQGAVPLVSLPGDVVGSVTPPATSPRGITPRNLTPRGELTLTPQGGARSASPAPRLGAASGSLMSPRGLSPRGEPTLKPEGDVPAMAGMEDDEHFTDEGVSRPSSPPSWSPRGSYRRDRFGFTGEGGQQSLNELNSKLARDMHERMRQQVADLEKSFSMRLTQYNDRQNRNLEAIRAFDTDATDDDDACVRDPTAWATEMADTMADTLGLNALMARGPIPDPLQPRPEGRYDVQHSEVDDSLVSVDEVDRVLNFYSDHYSPTMQARRRAWPPPRTREERSASPAPPAPPKPQAKTALAASDGERHSYVPGRHGALGVGQPGDARAPAPDIVYSRPSDAKFPAPGCFKGDAPASASMLPSQTRLAGNQAEEDMIRWLCFPGARSKAATDFSSSPFAERRPEAGGVVKPTGGLGFAGQQQRWQRDCPHEQAVLQQVANGTGGTGSAVELPIRGAASVPQTPVDEPVTNEDPYSSWWSFFGFSSSTPAAASASSHRGKRVGAR